MSIELDLVAKAQVALDAAEFAVSQARAELSRATQEFKQSIEGGARHVFAQEEVQLKNDPTAHTGLSAVEQAAKAADEEVEVTVETAEEKAAREIAILHADLDAVRAKRAEQVSDLPPLQNADIFAPKSAPEAGTTTLTPEQAAIDTVAVGADGAEVGAEVGGVPPEESGSASTQEGLTEPVNAGVDSASLLPQDEEAPSTAISTDSAAPEVDTSGALSESGAGEVVSPVPSPAPVETSSEVAQAVEQTQTPESSAAVTPEAAPTPETVIEVTPGPASFDGTEAPIVPAVPQQAADEQNAAQSGADVGGVPPAP